MLKIAVVGASGKVGRELIKLIETSPSEMMAVALVSPSSLHLGETSESGASSYGPLTKEALLECDVVIDFSKPDATMTLLDQLHGSGTALVVGTTGFSEQQNARLQSQGDTLPILIGSNFTYGFEPFASAGLILANAIDDADLTVGEIYHQHKKAAASGTTQRLCDLLSRTGPEGTTRTVAQDIQRIGDTPGTNTISLELGFATIELKLTVHSRQAYAAGALKAAKWLVGRDKGNYTPQDLYS